MAIFEKIGAGNILLTLRP